MVRTYRYRLYPTSKQESALDEQLRFACDLYNAALEQRRWRWRDKRESIQYPAQSAQLTQLRRQDPSLLPRRGMNYWAQQETLRRLDRAFQGFFNRVKDGKPGGYPRFKPYHRFNTLTWTLAGNAGGVAIRNGRLRLQGIGSVKVRWHRPLPENAVVGEARVSRRNGRWHVCFTLRLPPPSPLPMAGESVGLDVGIRHWVSLSTGEHVRGPRPANTMKARSRRAARRVSRRKPGSRRHSKAKLALARERERQARCRRDAAHKLARSLVSAFDLIAIEDLQLKAMTRSAKGTVETPGTGVARKRGLNREVNDQGWGLLFRFLDDKAEEAGRKVVRVDPRGTSCTCSVCGDHDKRSRDATVFRCQRCRFYDDADLNAAKVILRRAAAEADEDRPGLGRQASTAGTPAVA